jgi:hypothetical protein
VVLILEILYVYTNIYPSLALSVHFVYFLQSWLNFNTRTGKLLIQDIPVVWNYSNLLHGMAERYKKELESLHMHTKWCRFDDSVLDKHLITTVFAIWSSILTSVLSFLFMSAVSTWKRENSHCKILNNTCRYSQ